jgi:hypothetical protein
MLGRRMLPLLLMMVVAVCTESSPAQFVLFPKAGELVSPDKRFVVYNVDTNAPASDFIGTFHSLRITDNVNGHSRKLCDYFGVAAVAWSGNEFVMMTEYVSRKTSRTLLFSVSSPENVVMVDKTTLIGLVPVELRPTLRGNDHVFIEASRVEGATLRLRVWGYGQHDANGFRWSCDYALYEGSALCLEQRDVR